MTFSHPTTNEKFEIMGSPHEDLTKANLLGSARKSEMNSSTKLDNLMSTELLLGSRDDQNKNLRTRKYATGLKMLGVILLLIVCLLSAYLFYIAWKYCPVNKGEDPKSSKFYWECIANNTY